MRLTNFLKKWSKNEEGTVMKVKIQKKDQSTQMMKRLPLKLLILENWSNTQKFPLCGKTELLLILRDHHWNKCKETSKVLTNRVSIRCLQADSLWIQAGRERTQMISMLSFQKIRKSLLLICLDLILTLILYQKLTKKKQWASSKKKAFEASSSVFSSGSTKFVNPFTTTRTPNPPSKSPSSTE